jgi:hypothetical protein
LQNVSATLPEVEHVTTELSQRRDQMVGRLAPFLGRMVRRESFSLPGDINEKSRVLVVDSGDLTELLFFAPVLNHLKRRFPGMRVTMLVREGNGELIRTLENINELISYEPEHLALFSTTYLNLLRRVKSRNFRRGVSARARIQLCAIDGDSVLARAPARGLHPDVHVSVLELRDPHLGRAHVRSAALALVPLRAGPVAR